ncbi:hypothetical protein P171DRAFT_506299 [Karstenula rhodostoma CBS 690.94]|uniref:Uncharacterized protein n=1 Tax=Karstenula rhodostoma CBS 690.94 TaxID=1392251 RepID=A0A9P4P582_9PLEO|nr:hypothetical protein P171DRAFT_506299 [Karstenula rhodostoma CBS 690.94]
MPPEQGNHPPTAPSPHPSLVPAPLFSPHPSRSLPLLVDVGVDEPSAVDYRHDDVFWNSALEERGEEGLGYDILESASGTGRAYRVKEFPREAGDGGGVRATENNGGGGPAVQNFAFEENARGEEIRSHGEPAGLDFAVDATRSEGARSVSLSSSTFSNWDLYKPPTPPWPKRSSSLGRTHFEPVAPQHNSPAELGRRLRQEYDAHVMRGGGHILVEVQPPYAPFEINLPPNVLGGIQEFAEAHPLVDGGRRGAYRAVPAVGFEEQDGFLKETERKTPKYEERGWEGDIPRFEMTEAEGAGSGPGSAAGDSEPESLLSPPASLLASVAGDDTWEEAIRKARTGWEPDIADHPAFRAEMRARDIALEDGMEDELADTQEQEQERAPTSFRSKEGVPHPRQGSAATIEDEWPLTNEHPPPSDSNDKVDSDHSLHRTYTSASLPPQRPHTLPSEDEAEAFIHRHHSRTPSPTTALPYYAALLAAQATSIRHLNALIADLTDRSDYYEHDLLPRTLSHWATTNSENHVLKASLRRSEEENAMLWDMLEYSRKTLHLCWQRDEAALKTAKTMRVRKINRASCGLLERLVGSFGAGRGGRGGGGKERGWRRGGVESPFLEDVEQLVFVCEQNVRVLGEDLEDWSVGVQRVEKAREERMEEAREQRMEEAREERVNGDSKEGGEEDGARDL